jgi:hypothetical protein
LPLTILARGARQSSVISNCNYYCARGPLPILWLIARLLFERAGLGIFRYFVFYAFLAQGHAVPQAPPGALGLSVAIRLVAALKLSIKRLELGGMEGPMVRPIAV